MMAQYSGSVGTSLPLLQQPQSHYPPLQKGSATWPPVGRKTDHNEFQVSKILNGVRFCILCTLFWPLVSRLAGQHNVNLVLDMSIHLIWSFASFVCLQDLRKQDMGDCSYKQFPSSKPSPISPPPITSARSYEQGRGPPHQPLKSSQSPQSLESSSHNVHLHQTTFPFPNKSSAQTPGEHQAIPTHKMHPSGVRSTGSQAPRPQPSLSLADRECPVPTPAHHTAVPYSHPKFQPHPGLIPTTSPSSNSGTQAAAPQCNPPKPWRNQIKHDNQASVSVQFRRKLNITRNYIFN